jgi:hypothetical protein
MKFGRSFLAAAALAVATASAAQAGTKIMATAPANRTYPNFGGQLNCNILNMNKTARPVTIDIMDYAGNIIDTSGSQTLNPQQGLSIGDAVNTVAWCRFTVDGSTKKYRAAAVYSNGGLLSSSVVAK